MEDGSYFCATCKTPLNETDKNCWRCGSKDVRPTWAAEVEFVLVPEKEIA